MDFSSSIDENTLNEFAIETIKIPVNYSLNNQIVKLFSIPSHFSPDVNFCGYTVPHPADTKMHFRIQTTKDVRAVDVLRRGLVDLEKVCSHTLESFDQAYQDHQQSS